MLKNLYFIKCMIMKGQKTNNSNRTLKGNQVNEIIGKLHVFIKKEKPYETLVGGIYTRVSCYQKEAGLHDKIYKQLFLYINN